MVNTHMFRMLFGILVSLSVMFSGASLASTAQAIEPDPVVTTPSSVPVQEHSESTGYSDDSDAITAAAESYTSGDAAAAVELADAAAAADAVPLVISNTGFAVETLDGSVEISLEGDTTLKLPSGVNLGISVAGDPESVTIKDGVVVQEQVAPSTDIVTRATEEGVQLVAILGDKYAPNTVDFPLIIPAEAKLVSNADGTISVVAPVEVEESLPGEDDRVLLEVSAILGKGWENSELSDEDFMKLSTVEPAETKLTIKNRTVSVIEAPWAVDAEGNPIDTHYEIVGDTIRQVIETDSNTVFPVTADPTWIQWLWTSVQCIADLGLIMIGTAKLAGAIIKIEKIAKTATKIKAAIEKLGGSSKLLEVLKKVAQGIGAGNWKKYITANQVAGLLAMTKGAINLFGDALGIGSCMTLLGWQLGI